MWTGVLAGADEVVRFALLAQTCDTGYTKIELAMPGALAAPPGRGNGVRSISKSPNSPCNR